MRNVAKRYQEDASKGLVSRAMGKPSNRKYPDDFKNYALELVANKYADFGPTLAAKYLWERDKVKISTETLRLWMIGNNIHKLKRSKRVRSHFMGIDS